MQYKHTVPTLEQIEAERPIVRNTRDEARKKMTALERFALSMTHSIGSMACFFFLLLWSVVWLGWNLLAPVDVRFDPAPAFVIWLFVSNVIQLVLLPLIMVGQNLDTLDSELRAQADYETNLKTEREVEVIIAHLENQNQMLLELVHKIDRR